MSTEDTLVAVMEENKRLRARNDRLEAALREVPCDCGSEGGFICARCIALRPASPDVKEGHHE